AVAEMMQGDGGLDEPLIKLASGAVVVGPQLFPGFVRLEELAIVEVGDAFEVEGIVVGHRGYSKIRADDESHYSGARKVGAAARSGLARRDRFYAHANTGRI